MLPLYCPKCKQEILIEVKTVVENPLPENVIRAFVTKIVAHEDGFDWYLRFSPDNDPKKLGIEGKRKDSAHQAGKCVVIATHSNDLAKPADVVFRLKKGELQQQ